MNQILSQSEVDALLSAVTDPDSAELNVDSKSKNSGSLDVKVIPYDLGNQDRVIRGRMVTFDVIYERFVRLFRVSLSTSLRKVASLSIISTDLLKFGEFLNTLPIPSCIGLIRFESLRGSGLIILESKLVYALVDAYFGGSDRSLIKGIGKEYTQIELSIIEKVIHAAILDLDEAWKPVHKTDISFVRVEVNPQFIGLVPPTDVIVSTTFEVELEHASGTISIVVPYATLEPIKEKLNTGFQVEGDKFEKIWISQIKQHLNNTSLNCKVYLGHADIKVSDLINLNKGDIIPLNCNADGELDFQVENTPKLKCIFGESKGNKAVQITNRINKG